MSARFLNQVILVAAFFTALVPWAFSQTAATNESLLADLPFALTVNREVDLMRSLFAQTNKSFDLKVCKSVNQTVKDPKIISYRLISFVFYYPTGVVYLATSNTEMDLPDELVCTRQGIARRATTNEISANCVRVLDAHRKEAGADLEMLLGVAPLGNPRDIQYVRRSFRYVYKNGWRED